MVELQGLAVLTNNTSFKKHGIILGHYFSQQGLKRQFIILSIVFVIYHHSFIQCDISVAFKRKYRIFFSHIDRDKRLVYFLFILFQNKMRLIINNSISL